MHNHSLNNATAAACKENFGLIIAVIVSEGSNGKPCAATNGLTLSMSV
jgi:hypothetical protein